MPAIRCPACDYRNFHAAHLCNNCGATLNPQEVQKVEPAADTHISGAEFVGARRPPAGPQAPRRRDLVPQGPLSPVPVKTQVIEYSQDINLTPYEVDATFGQHQERAFQPISITEEPAEKTPPAWMTDRMPWYLPASPPKLYGKIIHIQSELQFPDYPNLFRALVDILSEFIWMGANQPVHKEGERIQVTIVRIRTDEGEAKDARLLGYLRGANLSLGDMVSLWGWKRRGSLTVKRGYNHTSKAVVNTNIMSMLLPALIVMGIIGFIFFIAFAWNNIESAWALLIHTTGGGK